MEPAATIDCKFRTFLLMTQFEAKAIGSRIALARDEAGLTQEQLAEISSFSKRSLQDYESGKTIPYKHMREISELLNREVPWFLHGEPSIERGLGEQLEAIRQCLANIEARLDALLPTANPGIDAVGRTNDG
jgi:transcriptional regulator with XRE-family HTH domain